MLIIHRYRYIERDNWISCHIVLSPSLSLSLSAQLAACLFILMLTRKLTSEILLGRPAMKVFFWPRFRLRDAKTKTRLLQFPTDCNCVACASIEICWACFTYFMFLLFLFLSFSIFHLLFSAPWRWLVFCILRAYIFRVRFSVIPRS